MKLKLFKHKYKYFITFLYSGNTEQSIGVGSIQLAFTHKIRAGNDIEEITKYIEKEANVNKVLILNFRKF